MSNSQLQGDLETFNTPSRVYQKLAPLKYALAFDPYLSSQIVG